MQRERDNDYRQHSLKTSTSCSEGGRAQSSSADSLFQRWISWIELFEHGICCAPPAHPKLPVSLCECAYLRKPAWML